MEMGLRPILLVILADAVIFIIGCMRDLASMMAFFNVEMFYFIRSKFKRRPITSGLS
jgi:hypothetical protein